MDETLIAEIEKAYGLSISGLEPLSGGHIHEVWAAACRRGPVVLKRYRGVDPGRLLISLELQRAAHSAGLPVPAVVSNRRGALAAETSFGWVTVQQRAGGSHRKPERFTTALAASVGRTLGRLHRVLAELSAAPTTAAASSGAQSTPPPPNAAQPTTLLPPSGIVALTPDPAQVRSECEAWIERLSAVPDPDEWDLLAVEEAEYRLRLLPAHALRPGEDEADAAQWTHGDFYPGNLLFDERDRVVAVLDWDFAAFRRRGGEVARAAFEVARSSGGGLDRVRFDAFLGAYLDEVPLTREQRGLMFRQLFFHQLAVLYPLALRRTPGAALPAGWQALARRRYEVVREIERGLDTLTEWALAARP